MQYVFHWAYIYLYTTISKHTNNCERSIVNRQQLYTNQEYSATNVYDRFARKNNVKSITHEAIK